MNLLIFWSLFLSVLSLILLVLSLFLSRKSYVDREKMSPFECGFDPSGSSRLPFSLRFYLVALIFLIFDVELVLLFPLVVVSSLINIMTWVTVGGLFIWILLLGLYYEWNQGALNWK